jgi:hypothetical protein
MGNDVFGSRVCAQEVEDAEVEVDGTASEEIGHCELACVGEVHEACDCQDPCFDCCVVHCANMPPELDGVGLEYLVGHSSGKGNHVFKIICGDMAITVSAVEFVESNDGKHLTKVCKASSRVNVASLFG